MLRVFATAVARVTCGLMADHAGKSVQPADTDPFMAAIMSLLITLLWVVLARAAGLGWKGVLHWTGELLLIIGILLAAMGISDVRREWTGRPGFWGSINQKAHAFGVRAASFLWVRWNRAVEKWPRLAKWLHLRIHLTHVHSRDAMVLAETAMAAAAVPSVRVSVSGNTVEERLDQLEMRVREANQQISFLNAWHTREVRDRQAATEEERPPGWPRTSVSTSVWPILLEAA